MASRAATLAPGPAAHPRAPSGWPEPVPLADPPLVTRIKTHLAQTVDDHADLAQDHGEERFKSDRHKGPSTLRSSHRWRDQGGSEVPTGVQGPQRASRSREASPPDQAPRVSIARSA